MATTNEIEKNENRSTNLGEEMDVSSQNVVDSINDAPNETSIKDIPVDEPMDAEFIDAESDDENDIDIVCEMLNDAKRERDDQIERQQRDEEMQRKRRAENAMAAKRAENEKERQAEESRRISEGRHIRKKMKRRATVMLFCLCIMSAVFGYVVAGMLIHILFNPKVWIFVGVMGIFGMINTLIHTYLYRYIREEIYRR